MKIINIKIIYIKLDFKQKNAKLLNKHVIKIKNNEFDKKVIK